MQENKMQFQAKNVFLNNLPLADSHIFILSGCFNGKKLFFWLLDSDKKERQTRFLHLRKIILPFRFIFHYI